MKEHAGSLPACFFASVSVRAPRRGKLPPRRVPLRLNALFRLAEAAQEAPGP